MLTAGEDGDGTGRILFRQGVNPNFNHNTHTHLAVSKTQERGINAALQAATQIPNAAQTVAELLRSNFFSQ